MFIRFLGDEMRAAFEKVLGCQHVENIISVEVDIFRYLIRVDYNGEHIVVDLNKFSLLEHVIVVGAECDHDVILYPGWKFWRRFRCCGFKTPRFCR